MALLARKSAASSAVVEPSALPTPAAPLSKLAQAKAVLAVAETAGVGAPGAA
jgi:hypothetical protein